MGMWLAQGYPVSLWWGRLALKWRLSKSWLNLLALILCQVTELSMRWNMQWCGLAKKGGEMKNAGFYGSFGSYSK